MIEDNELAESWEELKSCLLKIVGDEKNGTDRQKSENNF